MKRWRGLLIVLLLFVLLAGLTWQLVPQPDLFRYRGESRAYLDRSDRLLRLTLAEDDRYRLFTTLDALPPSLVAATLLYEDQSFYQHPGVDIPALFRAFWTTYIRRERPVGASTITMQVARLRWSLKTRSPLGKLQQILRALQLSRHYTKEELLEAYFNLASYGRNVEGVGAASQIYFNKPPSQLTLPEALSLCVIPQNPVRRNPTTVRGLDALTRARNALYERWVQQSPEDERFRSAFELPLAVRPPEKLPFRAPHWVVRLDQTLPSFQRGRIQTTLDSNLQQMAEQQLHLYLQRRRSQGLTNGAVAILNHRTMALEAQVGSADFWDARIQGQVDGTSALRSPGSTLKPFVYGLAMDQGLIHPMTLLKDAPLRYAGFTPENYDRGFLGPVLARDALIGSRNVPVAELLRQLTGTGLYGMLQVAGVPRLRPQADYGLALTLGGVEVSMQHLLTLYAALPNGGRWQPMRQLRTEPLPGSGQAIMSPEASFLVLDILKDNPPPGGETLPGQVRESATVAWKTGTSYAYRDAWAIGVSGPYVVAVWIGHFDGRSNPALVGRTAAGPLLFDVLKRLQQHKNGHQWSPMDRLESARLNLESVPICLSTGDLPGRYCPQETPGWFIPGVSPIKVSTVHRAIPIHRETGLRACSADPQTTRMETYQFWPSDIRRVFQQAGIFHKQPPPYDPTCGMAQRAEQGASPQIQSPVRGVDYYVKESGDGLPLMAISDSGVQHLFWFANNRFLGKVAAGQALFWQPTVGRSELRVVDDHGRATIRLVSVVSRRDH